jgi:epoxyqueuosine reductase
MEKLLDRDGCRHNTPVVFRNPAAAVTLVPTDFQLAQLAAAIKAWGRELGFQRVGVADIDLDRHERQLLDWLAAGWHGEMAYMARHGLKRGRPAELVPGTVRVISARMDYLPPEAAEPWSVLGRPELGYISRYALGRDYHKVLRSRLQRLAERIAAAVGPFGHRVFADSAPVLEKALAEKAGLGWIGKHSNLLDRAAGSWFFLGEIFLDLPLPVDEPATAHCGRCTTCLDVCPTRAIVAPYRVDARRCISYHTIELRGPIPAEFRRAIGNRVYGCDDCQLACPWNRFARPAAEPDFRARHGLDAPGLVALFAWDEAEFLRRTEGSAIRRIGHERWLRNVAVALGNAPRSPATVAALRQRLDHRSALVREHVTWALGERAGKMPRSGDCA